MAMIVRRRRVKNIELVDKRVADKIKLWILRVILDFGGFREFYDTRGFFSSDELAIFLGLEEFVENDFVDTDRKAIKQILNQELIRLEKEGKNSSLPILQKNIQRFAKLLSLGRVEQKIVEFVALMHHYDILKEGVSLLGDNIDRTRLYKILAILLDERVNDVKRALDFDAKLVSSSLIRINPYPVNLPSLLELIDENFVDKLINFDADVSELLKEWIDRTKDSELEIEDFSHIKEDVTNILEYLQVVVGRGERGVNILFYGVPGTGKSELSRVVAKELGLELFEVSYTKERGGFMDGASRLEAYKMAQALFANRAMLLLYDEAEDIFDRGVKNKERQIYKA